MARMHLAALALAAGLAAVPAGRAPAAEAEAPPAQVALVIGNADYAHAPDAQTARRDAIAVADALAEAGFAVELGVDLGRAGMRDRIEGFAAAAAGAERAVVYVSGHAQRMAGASYLAPVDARGDTPVSVALDTVPLAVLLEAAAGAAAGAVVFLDVAQLAGYTPRDFAEPGFAEIAPPAGVLLVSAAAPGRAIRRSPDRESRFARLVLDRFLEPDAPAMAVARELAGQLWSAGATDPQLALYTPPPLSAQGAALEREIELAIWQAAERSGAEEDYRAYLDSYPEGVFSQLAANRLRQIAEASRDPNEAAEAALGLDRRDRRGIQRALAELGHDPRGIDGVFGPATRRAIRRWQRAGGLDPTGYLTADQLGALGRDAERAAEARAAAQAEETRRAAEREDAHWQATGALGTPEGLRAYLARYPEGRYAEKAEAGLERHAEVARDQALNRERRLWREVETADTAAAYRRYLAEYPDGAFAHKAERRLARIETAEREEAERRRAAGIERALGLNAADRRSLEERLGRLGYDPGPPDGRFDRRTRRAIGAFQRDRGLAETGYLDRRSLVVLVRQTGGPRRAATDGEIVIDRLLEALSGQ